MTVRTPAVTIGTTPTQISGTDDGEGGHTVVIQPAGDVYLGGPDVTVSTGILAAAGLTTTVENLPYRDVLYAVAAANTAARVMRIGVQ